MDAQFDLRVRFTGLCLFVPHVPTKRMHVLLPQTGHDPSSGNHVEDHLVCLEYSAANAGNDEAADPIRERLTNCAISFGPNVAGGAETKLLKEVADLTAVTGSRIDVTKNHGVNVRVQLDAGRATHRRGLGKWDFPTLKNVRLANTVRWTVKNVPGSELILNLRDLRNGEERTVRLVPHEGVISLSLGHMPEDEYQQDPCNDPNEPPAPYWPHHAMAYFKLFAEPTAAVLPVLKKKEWGIPYQVTDDDGPDDECPALREGAARGRTFSCFTLGAQAT